MESECLTVVMEEKRQNRIGIITMYYNSSNYGGLLQAYALCKYLNDSGYPTKQITYDFYRKTISSSKDYKNLVSFLFKRLQKRTNNLIIKMIIALKTVITYLIYLLLEVIRSGILMYLDQVSFCLL